MIETLTEEKKADSTALDHDKDNIANLENKNKVFKYRAAICIQHRFITLSHTTRRKAAVMNYALKL